MPTSSNKSTKKNITASGEPPIDPLERLKELFYFLASLILVLFQNVIILFFAVILLILGILFLFFSFFGAT